MRRIRIWALRVGLTVVALLTLQVSLLAFPAVWFSDSERHSRVSFYSDSEIDADLHAEFLEVEKRLAALKIGDTTGRLNVFVCKSSSLYRFFAGLTFVPATVPGFNISLLDNSFISLQGLANRSSLTNGYPNHTAVGGDIGHSITHELVHDLMVSELGFFKNLDLPVWKREGFVEYCAGLVFTQTESAESLEERITYALSLHENSRAREYLLWGLTIEYLSEIERLSFHEIMNDSVTSELAQKSVLYWHEKTTSQSIPTVR